jgi:hypothetical protein
MHKRFPNNYVNLNHLHRVNVFTKCGKSDIIDERSLKIMKNK